MERRTFVSGLLIAGAGLSSHWLTKNAYLTQGQALSPADFAETMKGVQLQFVSRELLLKLYSRTVSDFDRQALVSEVVNHNRNLFVVDAYKREHGQPGFYRVTE
ncbi:hypothetical protein [Pseudomonas aeruginosa]|uniref:hypothetical protein n=1 Tax=Pseudomonas aeruginosa TaxID=287 RepID=UPI000B5A78EA|nr:hypothetical protein [Pseudomonas aeruginosa]ELN4741034.1 hypothetical protein [Escherichia coli]ASJ88604.1 hypothetical protein PSA83_06478 [Pseudomonas aeruginosa]MBO8337012.1 hypothetical protein [Pseudomonas aeruginosa]MCO3749286.1 hypothetical protein [Pseudomonas aeruginosa]RUE83525.1 hypothetical protein IPC1135_32635 [Pseudomonas aeruginosa]